MNNPFRSIHAALFDLDGTLIETHIDFPYMKREMIALAARYGAECDGLDRLDILTVVETAKEQLEAQNRYEEAKRFRSESFACLERIEIEQCGQPILLDGAAELLDRLRESGIKVGVVTRNCRSVSLKLLGYGGLICDALLTRDDVARTKPDPAHLIAALESMLIKAPLSSNAATNAKDATPSVMVGDHWMDVQAGKAAGMRTVGVLKNRADGFFDEIMPDLVVKEIGDLLPLVNEAFGLFEDKGECDRVVIKVP